MAQYGNWIYYPWSNTLLRLLPEDEFVEVRTNRNKLKITQEEQKTLSSKKIAVVGLSVGNAIATTLALERVCGEMIVIDYDEIELSNLNRIKTSLTNLGKNKSECTSQAIAEIDPYIKVHNYVDALTKHNVNEVLFKSKPDIIIEVCDSLDLKVLIRDYAKKHQVPVIMETNDNCMIDIERFDLNPERPIFHGIAGDLSAESLEGLTTEEKVPYILRIVGADNISTRLKSSMLEIDQSLTSWPQLGSSVIMGAGVTVDVTRKILLNQNSISGRFYINIDTIIGIHKSKPPKEKANASDRKSHVPKDVINFINERVSNHSSDYDNIIDEIVNDARKAPSAGNNQPWLIIKYYNHLLICHQEQISNTWGDYAKMGALMSMGGLIETIRCSAVAAGLNAEVVFNVEKSTPLAHITISKLAGEEPDIEAIDRVNKLKKRHTDRVSASTKPIDPFLISQVILECNTITPIVITDKDILIKLANWAGECDKIRIFNEEGHKEFFNELRWNDSELASTKDGISIQDAGLTEAEKAGFYMAKDYESIELIKQLNLGNGFKKISQKNLSKASTVIIYTIKNFNRSSLIQAGGEILHQWAKFNSVDIAVYPMLSIVFMLNRYRNNAIEGLSPANLNMLNEISNDFYKLLNISDESCPIFLMKLSHKTHKVKESVRKDLNEIYIKYA
jgi:hypothetical protein